MKNSRDNIVSIFESGSNIQPLEFYLRQVKENPDSSQCWIDAGYAYRRAGQDDKKLECFQKAYDLAPDDLHAIMALAGAKTFAGEYEEAQALYRSYDGEPDARFLTAVGKLYWKWEKPALARYCLSCACERPDADDDARNALGKFKEQYGPYDQPGIPAQRP